MEAAKNREQAPEAVEENAGGEAARETKKKSSGKGLKGSRSLRRLRNRVERVAQELHTLRDENASLQKRIAELEAMPAADREASGVGALIDSDPDTLKRKVEGFIEAIDRYLEDNETP